MVLRKNNAHIKKMANLPLEDDAEFSNDLNPEK
jgi:hypothetical protein